MRKRLLFVLIALLLPVLIGGILLADEGQWLPEQIADFDWPALSEFGEVKLLDIRKVRNATLRVLHFLRDLSAQANNSGLLAARRPKPNGPIP